MTQNYIGLLVSKSFEIHLMIRINSLPNHIKSYYFNSELKDSSNYKSKVHIEKN